MNILTFTVFGELFKISHIIYIKKKNVYNWSVGEHGGN